MGSGYADKVAIIDGQRHAIVAAWPDSFTAKCLTERIVNAFLESELLGVEAFGSRFPVIVKEIRRDTDTFCCDVAGEKVAVDPETR